LHLELGVLPRDPILSVVEKALFFIDRSSLCSSSFAQVPEFKPEASLEFLGRWIRGDDWRPYDASCTPEPELVQVSQELVRVEAQIRQLQDKAKYLRSQLSAAAEDV
jgi:hypothetical protein